MTKLVAVVEMIGPSESKKPPWLVAQSAEGGLLRLSGGSSDAEVGGVAWQLIVYNDLQESEPFRAAIAAENLVLPGGLAVEDQDGKVLRPGCCSGLETWREWWSVPKESGSPWMGHDPAPWIEDKGDVLRIWSDGGLSERPRAAFSIDVQRDELSFQLARVERDLQGFLQRLATWAESQDPNAAPAFVDRFDQMFEITRAGSRPRGA